MSEETNKPFVEVLEVDTEQSSPYGPLYFITHKDHVVGEFINTSVFMKTELIAWARTFKHDEELVTEPLDDQGKVKSQSAYVLSAFMAWKHGLDHRTNLKITIL